VSDHRPRRFVIVGGGASGVLMALHLLRGGHRDIRVTIVEMREQLGRGLAYATGNPSHLLNVRAANMSAFADDRDHFSRWLAARAQPGENRDPDGFRFVSRKLYGLYLQELLEPYRSKRGALTVLCDQARAAIATANGIELVLQSGANLQADAVVLACGHEGVLDERPPFVSPWREPVGAGAPAESTLLILGTGLTMVDATLALSEAGHRGRIVVVSRRGLLPHAHRAVDAFKIDAAAAPFDQGVAKICRWLRTLARQCEAEGGDWRSIVDGLRPHTQALWRAMALPARRRFLEHARPWWDIHRHRMAPEVADRLRALIASGQVEVVAGRILGVAADERGARVSIRRRGARRSENLYAAHIIRCTGAPVQPPGSANPLLG
jgi:uncharacterized NAD(P)/FAD-binding protein YdhS